MKVTGIRSRTYESFDFHEHMELLSQLQVSLQPAEQTKSSCFHTTFSALYLPNVYVARVRYGIAAAIAKTANDWSWHHVLSMPLSGSLRSVVTGAEKVADANHYILRSPSCVQQFETTAEADELFIAIDPDFLRSTCSNLIGQPVSSEIRFSPEMPAGAAHAKALVAASTLCLGDVQAAKICGSHLQEHIATILLLHQPHNYWNALFDRVPLPAPRDVKRALDFIHANLFDDIVLGDLVAVANVPGRTLNEHFRRFVGMSPMAYIRRERLLAARKLLMLDASTSVTAVAARCGFAHLGRFSIDYKRAFGESPSATRAGILRDRRAGRI